MAENLTTLANLKAWKTIASTVNDVDTMRLISQVSQAILSFCQRPSFLNRSISETYDGTGSNGLMLRQWPVTSILSLGIGGVSITPSVDRSAGFLFPQWDGAPPGQPCLLGLNGYGFYKGMLNVAVSYKAGYSVANEAQKIPASPYALAPACPYGSWAADNGVSYANGTPLTAIPSGMPAVGQYVAPTPFAESPKLTYQFAAADLGLDVLLNYSYIPSDIENVCVEAVAERLGYKSRIGEKSHSSGGAETVSFLITDLTPWMKLLLQPYKKVVFT